jgi:TDG/mug DNA glycosylase family protein
MKRPTPDELRSAAGGSIPDLVRPGLRVLFVGINPGLYSGATGHHFARPGNRFWPALHGAGFSPRLLQPDETDELLALGIGITNLVNRTTATAAELDPAELRAGGRRLCETVAAVRPVAVVVLGVTAYRTAFDRPKAMLGRQPEPLEGSALWLLPNPSGLNAHYQLPELIALFESVREALPEALLELRRATDGDVPEIADLVRAAYEGYEPLIGRTPLPMLTDFMIALREHEIWVLADGESLAGVLEFEPRDDMLWVENVAIDPARQRRGLGRRLLRFAEDEARRRGFPAVGLLTNERYADNIAMYSRYGYVETHRAPYEGTDLVYFRKELPG